MNRRTLLKIGSASLAQLLIAKSALAWVGARMRRSSPGALVAPGNQTITATGTSSFTVPVHNWLDIELWGGGGSGGDDSGGSNGNSGTATTCNGLSAGGGAGGQKGASTALGGAGGTASGGDTNTSGQNGENIIFSPPIALVAGAGGASPNGGAGGAGVMFPLTGNGTNGTAPGGGGGGCLDASVGLPSGGGGAGAYCKKRYLAGVLTPGSTLSYTVGTGGAAPIGGQTEKPGAGGNGQIKFTWG